MTDITGRAFIIRPFREKSNNAGEAPINFDKVHRELIGEALARVGLTGDTTEEFIQQGNIRTDMFRQLLAADLVIADISIHNANAFYELGIRHALRNQYTVLIKSSVRGDEHVFDLKADRYLTYDPDNPAASVEDLVKTIKATLQNESADSPVFQLLPGLKSVDPSNVVVVPLKFQERVAQTTDPQALLLLADELTSEAWETEGLRIIGRALFKAGDHQGSIKTWERIRKFDMLDLEANQKLATNYQKTGDFKLSEQAASRALKSPELTDWGSAETYSLMASNYKTQWHTALASEPDPAKRQRKALASPFLQQSYELYRKGFEKHRSHYYSGLNAVAMLSMQIELAQRHPDQWALEFKNEKFAELDLEERSEFLSKLIVATDLAIESSICNYPDDEWARISAADLMLIISDDPARVKLKYEKCTSIAAFNATSLQRQLQIYQDLDLFRDNVEAALQTVERR